MSCINIIIPSKNQVASLEYCEPRHNRLGSLKAGNQGGTGVCLVSIGV